MEQTLAYLRETLSNYLNEHEISQHIYEKISKKAYNREDAFIDDLNEKEVRYLSDILPDELRYAKEEQDEKRYHELNNIYGRLP
ncbi:sporulation protein [Schinkia sp. CFF1]